MSHVQEYNFAALMNVIRFMDGVLQTTKCTDKRIMLNAYCRRCDCDTMVNNLMAHGLMGYFSCAINSPGGWTDLSLMVQFYTTSNQKVGIYNICIGQRLLKHLEF